MRVRSGLDDPFHLQSRRRRKLRVVVDTSEARLQTESLLDLAVRRVRRIVRIEARLPVDDITAPTGAQHASDVRERRGCVADDVEHPHRDRLIHTRIGDRQPHRVALRHSGAEAFARPCEHREREIDAAPSGTRVAAGPAR